MGNGDANDNPGYIAFLKFTHKERAACVYHDPGDKTLGFLLFTADAKDSQSRVFPETISPQEAWERYWGDNIADGKDFFSAFLFIGQDSSPVSLDRLAPKVFLSLFEAVIATKTFSGNEKFLFWADADVPRLRYCEHVFSICLTKNRTTSGDEYVAIGETTSQSPTTQTFMHLRPFRFSVGRKSNLRVACPPPYTDLILSGSGSFDMNSDAWQAGKRVKSVISSGYASSICLRGDFPGRLSLTYDLASSSPSKEGMGLLQPSFRYAWRQTPESEKDAAMVFALFNRERFASGDFVGMTLDARIDPLRPDDSQRTRFLLRRGDGQPRSLPSFLTTPNGVEICLDVQDGESALAWDREMDASPSPDQARLYFSPMGEYGIDQIDVLCGLNGSETLRFKKGNARLVFKPGSPARAVRLKDYNPGKDPWSEIPEVTLSSSVTTAYVAPGGEADYTGLAVGGALYGGGNDSKGFFSPIPQIVAKAGSDGFFPLVPHCGLSAAGTSGAMDAEEFENSVLSEVRQRTMAAPVGGAHARPVDGTDRVLLTRQGMTLEIKSDTWATLTLARDASGGRLTIDHPDAALIRAIEQTDPFIVLRNGRLSGSLRIDGLPLGFTKAEQPGVAAENVAILKFCGGSIEEWLKKPSSWAGGAALNGDDFASLADWLDSYLRAALDAGGGAEPDPDYAGLVSIMRDPEWTGLVLLNAPLAKNTPLPPQFAGLATGIDASAGLVFHHLYAASVGVLGPDGQVGASSFHGLIDYKDPAYALAVEKEPGKAGCPVALRDGASRMKVLRLKAAIEMSRIRESEYLLQIAADTLFRSPVTGVVGTEGKRLDWPSMSLMMRGGSRVENGISVSTFTELSPVTYLLANGVLQAVEVNSIRRSDAGKSLRLFLGGRLNFRHLPEFDVLSFGTPLDASAESPAGVGHGLRYANLVLLGATDAADEAGGERTVFVEDRSAVTVAMDASGDDATPRAGSLFRAFPLTPTGLAEGGEDGAEAAVPPGWLAVDTGRSFAMLEKGMWMGLEALLELGSLGALGGNKPLSAKVILAWNPESAAGDAPGLALWLKFPGPDGVSLPNLQNFIALAFGGASLVANADGNSGTPVKGFTLNLNDAGLRILNIPVPPGASLGLSLTASANNSVFAAENRTLGWLGYSVS